MYTKIIFKITEAKFNFFVQFKTLDQEDKGVRILERIMVRVMERKNEDWIFF